MPYYVWDAEECFLDTVDAGKFCAAMSGRKGLLFVGERRREALANCHAKSLFKVVSRLGLVYTLRGAQLCIITTKSI